MKENHVLRRGWRASAIIFVVFGGIGVLAIPPGGAPGLIMVAVAALVVDVLADYRLRTPLYWYVSTACCIATSAVMITWLINR